jgi:AraC-like DNA-binding protein
VEDLAEIAGMGVSTLHQHFRVLTAMSPLQYQKQLWLQAARGRMLIDGLDAASAAFEVGYESASQFNREYRRFFGQPPMRDIRTLRSPSAPPLESVNNGQKSYLVVTVSVKRPLKSAAGGLSTMLTGAGG